MVVRRQGQMWIRDSLNRVYTEAAVVAPYVKTVNITDGAGEL